MDKSTIKIRDQEDQKINAQVRLEQINALAQQMYRQYPRDMRLYYLNQNISEEQTQAGMEQVKKEMDDPSFKNKFFESAKRIIDHDDLYAEENKLRKPYYNQIYKLLKRRMGSNEATPISSKFFNSGDAYSLEELKTLVEAIKQWPEKIDRKEALVKLDILMRGNLAYEKSMTREDNELIALFYNEKAEKEKHQKEEALAKIKELEAQLAQREEKLTLGFFGNAKPLADQPADLAQLNESKSPVEEFNNKRSKLT